MAVSVGRIEAILELKNRMSKGLKRATSDMGKFQSKMNKMGEQATRAGAVLTAGITVPVTALAVASVRSFASFEKSMAGVLAVTQATPKEFKKLTDLAKEMGETTVFTAGQSAEAMRAFGLAGFTTNEIMGALHPTLNLAAAGSMDMATAADIAAKVTRGYGIAASDTTHAMDVLTKAFTTANTNLVELGGAFKMVGPVAKTAGVSFEMTTAALQTMADAGIIGSMAGRQLRRALLRLVNPPGDAAKALARLGVNARTASGRLRPFDEIIEELQPHLRKTSDMAEIFGTVAMPGMVAILEKGSDELRSMTKALEESEGTGQRIADVMLDNLSGAFVLLQSAVEGILLAIGVQLEPMLRKLMVALTAVAHFISREVVPGFGMLHPSIKLVIAGIVALIAVAAPLILLFGMMAPAIPAITAAFLGLVSMINLPVIGFSLLVAIVALWIAKQAPLMRYIKALGKFWLGLGMILVKVARGAINIAIAMLEGLLTGIKDTVQFFTGGLAGKAFGFFTGLLEKAGDAMMNFGKETDPLAGKIEKVREEVSKLLEGQTSLEELHAAWWRLTKIGGHTEDTFRAIAERAMALEDSGQKLTGGVKKLADEFRATGDYLDGELDPIIEGTTERWEELAKTWKSGAIPEALAMVKALEAVGGITNLTVAEQQALHKTLDTAIDKYNALGQQAPQAMARLWQATRMVGEETLKIIPIIGGISERLTFAEAFPWLAEENQVKVSTGIDAGQVVGGIEPQGMVTMGQMMGASLKRGFAEVVQGIPNTIIGAFKGGGGLSGAFQAIGAQTGSTLGGSMGSAWGATIAGKDGVGKLMKGFAGMAGPIGAAVGALAGPLIGALTKLFSGPTTQESVTKASRRMFGRAISTGLADAIAATRSKTESDFGAMMVHMADMLNEMGGIVPNTIGIESAIGRVRDIFVALETGVISTQQAAKSFDDSFTMIADALVESGTIATEKFTELIALAGRFGTTAETIKFVGEQARLAAVGLAAMFGPTIEEAKSYHTAISADEKALEALNEREKKLQKTHEQQVITYEKLSERKKNGTVNALEFDRAENRLLQTMKEQAELDHERIELEDRLIGNREKLIELSGKSKAELADMGTIAVASFESALAAGMSFVDAVKAHGPALDAIIEAQKELGIETDNVALKELQSFQDRIKNNGTLVAGVEALDATMLALSRTGSLNAETLGAMERQGSRMYDKLIAKGFTQEQAVLMMGPALKTIMEAHQKLGIPVDENTQRLIDQAKEAGLLEDEQKTGWAAIETAVGALVSKMDTLITRLFEVKTEADKIPTEIVIDASVVYTSNADDYTHPNFDRDAGTNLDFSAAHGGIVTRPSIGLVGEAGPEAIIPLTNLESRDRALLSEVRGLKTELRNLPIHLRDAIILAQ